MQNGRWVEVKVNDRGPFIEGRILDLSFAAALELEMVDTPTPPYLQAPCDPMDDEGNVLLPDGPGLGCEIDWDYINDHRVGR